MIRYKVGYMKYSSHVINDFILKTATQIYFQFSCHVLLFHADHKARVFRVGETKNFTSVASICRGLK